MGYITIPTQAQLGGNEQEDRLGPYEEMPNEYDGDSGWIRIDEVTGVLGLIRLD